MRLPLALLAVAITLTGCMAVPKPLAGDYATVSPQQVRERELPGERVRWGGEIIRVDPGSDITCFEILGHGLSDNARPIPRDDNQGRFIACRKGFYDPEVFTRGREVTVTGHLDGSERRKVGEYDYFYPRVDADVVYLWPKRPVVMRYDPYPWGWSPFWGYSSFGPWWGPPPVVIVRPPPRRSPPPKPKG